MRRYLALCLPWLATDRRQRDHPGDARPMAAIVKRNAALVLAAVDRRAADLGIRSGLTLADARAQLPELAVFDLDRAGDQALLASLADACERYTPMVALDAHGDGLILDITGCDMAHAGGEAGLCDDLCRRLARLGLTANIALAGTPDAASALGRYPAAGDDVLALPVAALDVEAESLSALRWAGLKRIGDVAPLPRPALAARFGAAMTARLARLLGEQDVRIVPRRQPPAIAVESRLADPILHSAAALQVIAGLSNRVMADLAVQGLGGRRFELALFRTDHHVARLAVDTALPLRNAKAIVRLFVERIDSLADPLDPGFGYDLIRIAVPVAVPLAALQLPLEGGAVAAETGIAALIDQLSTRMGRNSITRAMPGDSHIPEQAAFDLPAIETPPPMVWPVPESGEPPLRPLYLFDPPQRVEVLAEVPDGPPRRFKWRAQIHEVLRHEGPERIAAEWWRRRDGQGLTRDYYRVEDARGRRYWLFRHGLYGREKAHPNWYLHGLFA